MTEKIKKFIKKGNYTKTKIVLLILISIIGAFILTSIARRGFIWDRIPILTVILFFAGSHFIFNIKELYNNIYKYRFYIAGIVLIYAVLMGYSGSSIGVYNDIIQPNNREIYYSPIFGDSRTIRTDEWAVNAPSFVSQCVDPNGNNYSYYHDSLRGTKTEMFSQLNQPILDILSIGKPFTLGALILGASRGYSFLWAASIIALLLVSFEFCMVISKNNKLASLLGMLLISFSASTQWWQCYNIFTWGMLAIVLFDKFMLTKKFSTKILCSIGIFISGISYIFYFYPTWQVPYGYIYLAVLIWVVIKNWKEYKINKKNILLIIAIILGILAISLTLKAYEGITNVFGRDSTSGDVSTSEFNISIYDESDFANGSTNENSQFSPTASGSIVQNAAEIKKYIKDTYHYRQGNDMSKYPLKIGDKDNSGYGVDCSTFVTWALIMSGYDQLKNKSQLTTADLYNLVSKNSGRCAGFGWTYSKTSEPTATAKPGDLLLKTTKPKHVEIYMGSGTYGAGSNRQIKKEGYISYSGKTFKQIVNSR